MAELLMIQHVVGASFFGGDFVVVKVERSILY